VIEIFTPSEQKENIVGIKPMRVTGILVLFILTLSSVATGMEKPGKLPPVVKAYPDKAFYEQKSREKLTLYTNDGFSKVSDFYQKTLSRPPVSKGKFLLGENVMKLTGPSHTDFKLWLEVSHKKHKLLKERDLFKYFHQEVAVKRIHSDKELEEVKKKYAHLAGAWYPDYDAKKELESCSEATRANVNRAKKKMPKRNKKQEQAMLAEMQALMAQGKHQEAAMLAQKSTRAGAEMGKAMQEEGKADHWKKLLDCLDEVDRHDFQTRIEIDLYYDNFKEITKSGR